MRTSELAKKVLDLLEERGWCQGTPEDANGQLCILGAIREACHGNPHETHGREFKPDYKQQPCDYLRKALGRKTNKGITIWNDSDDRTKKDVVEMLESLT